MTERRIDRPILFSGPMVRALLEGRKTQTRRVLKQQPSDLNVSDKPICEVEDYCTGAPSQGKAYYWTSRGCWNSSSPFKVPFQVGDLLWVRENFAYVGALDPGFLTYRATYPDCLPESLEYVPADIHDVGYRWKPSIHMPRSASRLTLEVTDVRLQRLQDISEEDAIAEGVDRDANTGAWWGPPGSGVVPETCARYSDPCLAFQKLWDSLNAQRGFGCKENPWVVALTFTVHKQNIDELMRGRGL